MGAVNKPHSQVTYYNTFKGWLVVKCSSQDEGAVKRTNKNGVEVWEKQYNVLENMTLVEITKRVSDEWGDSWNLTFKEGEETHVVQLSVNSRYSDGFVFRLPNIDLSKPMDLHIGEFTVDEKSRGWLTVHQEGKKVDSNYTKAEPNGLPPYKRIKVSGKEQWDATEQLEFIENMILEEIVPKLMANQGDFAQEETPDPVNEGEDFINPDDDLPF